MDIWSDYSKAGFTAEDIPLLIEVVINKDLHSSANEEEYWTPLHAWRVLGHLKAEEAIEPLIGLFNFILEIDDDWALGELPMVMGMIGEAAISPLSIFLQDSNNGLYARSMAAEGMKYIVENYPTLRQEVLKQYQQYLFALDCSEPTLNGFLISYLTDMKAIELIDDIRRVHETDCIDISIAGDLEDVEISLGLRTTRDTPRPKYYPMGIGEDLVESIQKELAANKTQATQTFIHESPKVGRNDPCPCGSGKKYKKCCLH